MFSIYPVCLPSLLDGLKDLPVSLGISLGEPDPANLARLHLDEPDLPLEIRPSLKGMENVNRVCLRRP